MASAACPLDSCANVRHQLCGRTLGVVLKWTMFVSFFLVCNEMFTIYLLCCVNYLSKWSEIASSNVLNPIKPVVKLWKRFIVDLDFIPSSSDTEIMIPKQQLIQKQNKYQTIPRQPYIYHQRSSNNTKATIYITRGPQTVPDSTPNYSSHLWHSSTATAFKSHKAWDQYEACLAMQGSVHCWSGTQERACGRPLFVDHLVGDYRLAVCGRVGLVRWKGAQNPKVRVTVLASGERLGPVATVRDARCQASCSYATKTSANDDDPAECAVMTTWKPVHKHCATRGPLRQHTKETKSKGWSVTDSADERRVEENAKQVILSWF